MEHLLFWSKYTNIHNIFKYVIFQKALLWNKGLSLDFGASFVRRNDGVRDKDVRHINSYSLCIPPKMRGGGGHIFFGANAVCRILQELVAKVQQNLHGYITLGHDGHQIRFW